ncbi:MAG: pilus assembly protein PilP, partial [Myxococcota bacterium]|nr:pilus assembly protein PilP [Myxococcota bacterium]
PPAEAPEAADAPPVVDPAVPVDPPPAGEEESVLEAEDAAASAAVVEAEVPVVAAEQPAEPAEPVEPVSEEQTAAETPAAEAPSVEASAAEVPELESPREEAPAPAAAPASAPPPLPRSPVSDTDALAAIDGISRRPSPAASTPDFGAEASERCAPASDPRSTPLSLLKMSRWDSEGGKPYAMLANREGESFRVEVGDRVGPAGGLVVSIDTNKVTVYELHLDAQDSWTEVRQDIKLQ